MIEWTHAERDGLCGKCNELIRQGDTIIEISVARVTKKFVRCAKCAGEAPPERFSTQTAPPVRDDMQPLHAALATRTRGALRQLAGTPLKIAK